MLFATQFGICQLFYILSLVIWSRLFVSIQNANEIMEEISNEIMRKNLQTTSYVSKTLLLEKIKTSMKTYMIV